MGGHSEANEVKGSMHNRRPVQTSIVQYCDRLQQIKTALSHSQ